MKKLIGTVLVLTMLLTLSTGIFAQSYNPHGNCDITFTIRRADPAYVIKDGIIGEGEYDRIDISTNPADTGLSLIFGSSDKRDEAEAMLQTMEYYFSYDHTHGLNIAVVTNPSGERVMNFSQGTSDPPGDEFLCNGGLQIELDHEDNWDGKLQTKLYYAIGRNPSTGEYLEGYYNQLGRYGNYDPEPGKDYIITTRDDGSIVYEWSIPYDVFSLGSIPFGTFHFSIGTYSGSGDSSNSYQECFGVGLGDYVFMGDHNTGNPSSVTCEIENEVILKQDLYEGMDIKNYYGDRYTEDELDDLLEFPFEFPSKYVTELTPVTSISESLMDRIEEFYSSPYRNDRKIIYPEWYMEKEERYNLQPYLSVYGYDYRRFGMVPDFEQLYAQIGFATSSVNNRMMFLSFTANCFDSYIDYINASYDIIYNSIFKKYTAAEELYSHLLYMFDQDILKKACELKDYSLIFDLIMNGICKINDKVGDNDISVYATKGHFIGYDNCFHYFQLSINKNYPFTDVLPDSWYRNAVTKVNAEGLMTGMAKGIFSPNTDVTRAQLVTILYRLSGTEETGLGADTGLSDVANHWASDAIGWAVKNGIVRGYEDGTFGPDKAVTRNELATLIMRYLEYIKIKISDNPLIDSFADSAKIPNWAKDNVEAMRKTGLIAGDDKGNFNPGKSASRAEIATIFTRLLPLITG